MSTKMPVSHINDLPEELLELILNNVKETEYPALFCNSLRTCQKWHRVGLGLYRGLGYATAVVIDSDNRRNEIQHDNGDLLAHMETRFNFEIPSKLYLSLLKSLTIQIQHRRNTTLFTLPRGADFLGSLTTVLSQTVRLTTFSLNFSDGWDFPNLDVPAIPQSWLAKIVAILPDSVSNLELDCAGIDVAPNADIRADKNDHLCYQISKILTRLRHLRLRTGHVCNTLFGDTFAGPSYNDVRYPGQSASKHYADAVSNLISQWHMRALTIWLPWGSTLTSDPPFSRACTALLDPKLRNPTVILVVQQTDVYCPKRMTIATPALAVNSKFTWTPHTNVSPSLRNALPDFRFATVCGLTNPTTQSRERAERRQCKECVSIAYAPTRHYLISNTFSPPPEPDTATSYPHVAIQTVENMLSWSSNNYLSYRFPLAEADEPSKPFWRGQDRWSCQLPGCRVKSKSMVHLRGHQMYKHAIYTSYGELRCPSPGCGWVGETHSDDGEAYNAHLMEHHFEPCVPSKLDTRLASVPL